MSTNTKLAEALRLAREWFRHEEAGEGPQVHDVIEAADEALAAHEAEQALPLKDRPDFIAGYDAGLKDGRACERRDAAEQAAQAVPAGFKWVPVEPTEDMLTAAVREDDKAFVDGMPHGATAADVWAVMLSAAPRPGAVAGWQPIETAPKDGSLFLCWVEAVQYGENDEGQQYQIDVSQVDFCQWQSHDDAPDGGWFEPCCGHISDHQRVTHWMPLPAAPQEPTHD